MRFAFCLLLFALGGPACSVPNLESAACTQARDELKRFYSGHLGRASSDAGETSNSVTSELAQKLSERIDDDNDYFTSRPNREAMPISFRIGECSSTTEAAATLQVRLFSRNDQSNFERMIWVTMKKREDRWLVDEVPGHIISNVDFF